MKIVKKKSTENWHFYSREKSLYIAWACFRNEFDLFIYLFNIGSNRAKMELLLLLPLLSLVTCAPLGEQANPLEGLEDINSRGKVQIENLFLKIRTTK